MFIETVKWIEGIDGFLEMIDQRLLPGRFEILRCRDTQTLFEAIRTLAVRGAPAIGVAAAYGLCLAAQTIPDDADAARAMILINQQADYLATARPTAVNLFWALDRIRRCAHTYATLKGFSIRVLRETILTQAHVIANEDKLMCLCIGQFGEPLIPDGGAILTHCNAGALATAGQGTALSPLYEAHRKGKRFAVYADETRPLLQGARLTAWELRQPGIAVTVICDNMAAWLMKQGRISAVIVGADRIAANGDTANKIGTYGLSVLAVAHGIPFYVAAPSSTFDLSIPDGSHIVIEQRSADEVTSIAGFRLAPEGVGVYNPAFDVTDAARITAIITEHGLIERPTNEAIAKALSRTVAPSGR
jgi:methylthioribose-1-phosphate isomerase